MTNARRICVVAAAILCPAGVLAETIVAARTIPSRTVIQPSDLTVLEDGADDAVLRPEDIIGRETTSVVFKGQPIEASDLSEPAVVERNSNVTLIYEAGSLTILANGRALGRAAIGETVAVTNVSSRKVLSGRVVSPGHVVIGEKGR